jgi:hypothetical protein
MNDGLVVEQADVETAPVSATPAESTRKKRKLVVDHAQKTVAIHDPSGAHIATYDLGNVESADIRAALTMKGFVAHLRDSDDHAAAFDDLVNSRVAVATPGLSNDRLAIAHALAHHSAAKSGEKPDVLLPAMIQHASRLDKDAVKVLVKRPDVRAHAARLFGAEQDLLQVAGL